MSSTNKLEYIEDCIESSDEDIWKLFDNLSKTEDLSVISDDIEDDINMSEGDSDQCPNCNAKNSLVENRKEGFVVCNECAIICSDLLDHNPEWIALTQDYGLNGNPLEKAGFTEDVGNHHHSG